MNEAEVLPGTLSFLILQTLGDREAHGYAIARRIECLSDDQLRIEQGSLYPALARMEAAGWLQSRWGTSDAGRRVRVYRLTRTGRARAGLELQRWEQFVDSVKRVVGAGA